MGGKKRDGSTAATGAVVPKPRRGSSAGGVIKAKRTRAARAGLMVQRPLYGHMLDPDRRASHVLDPVTAPIVRWIYERLDAGVSSNQICRDLCAAEVPPPSGKTGRWFISTVSLLVRHSLYRGEYVSGKILGEGVVVAHPHLAIVDEALWSRVNAAQRRRRETRIYVHSRVRRHIEPSPVPFRRNTRRR